MQAHGIAAANRSIALRIIMDNVQNAALADHGVEINVLFQPLPQLQRMLVKGHVARFTVIGADDGGVAPDIARADPTFFNDSNIGQAVVFGQIIGRGEPMTAATHNNGVIFGLWLRLPPGGCPVFLAFESLSDHIEKIIAQDSPHSPA